MNFVLSFKLNEVIGIVLMITIQLYLIGHYDNELNDFKREIKKIIIDALEQDKKMKEKNNNDGEVIDTEDNIYKEYDTIFQVLDKNSCKICKNLPKEKNKINTSKISNNTTTNIL